jgi:Domain of unknown function (DUF4845)
MSIRRRQRGITAIGMLILLCLLGVVGIAVMRITPLYLQHMRLATVMKETGAELAGVGATPAAIRNTLGKHFIVEGMRIPADDIKIAQSRNGYSLRIQHESRVPFIADIWFLLVFDQQVEITR